VAAARKALDMAGRKPGDIDQIIYATCTPDTLIPSTACWLQHKIGAPQAWAMDINAACSGFIYGLATADQFIQSGQTRTALVVGAEVLNPFINWQDRGSCILFGDGAGAAVVERTKPDAPARILSSHLLSDGNLWELLYIPAGGSRMEVTPGRFSKNLNKIRMTGKEIFKVAVRTLAEFANRSLESNGFTMDDVDWFIPHQANYRIIEAVAKRLNCPMEKVVVNVDRYGNTSAATIPTALDEAVRDGRIKKGTADPVGFVRCRSDLWRDFDALVGTCLRTMVLDSVIGRRSIATTASSLWPCQNHCSQPGDNRLLFGQTYPGSLTRHQ
jgi:3-oxoacyl-[acyl-carrier-protein] synthase-3